MGSTGASVGFFEGLGVGFFEGCGVGSGVTGDSVGESVGLVDGFGEGSNVGRGVGRGVGSSVTGETVGELDGAQISSYWQVWDPNTAMQQSDRDSYIYSEFDIILLSLVQMVKSVLGCHIILSSPREKVERKISQSELIILFHLADATNSDSQVEGAGVTGDGVGSGVTGEGLGGSVLHTSTYSQLPFMKDPAPKFMPQHNVRVL